ncbi:hypothetical protein ACIPJM_04135 [Streptomyces halstedii]|uniref:hypothetical protein n=1 Tax=Streptomyces halstedii TaxID=1944 RepID=UPI003806AC85
MGIPGEAYGTIGEIRQRAHTQWDVPVTAPFPLLTTRFGNAVAVNTWNSYTWKPALAKADVIPPRAEGAKAWPWAAAPQDGSHVLGHTYASIMPEAGASVVTLARWLGHSSSAITLGYYAHFMPEAGSKGRGTTDGRLGERGERLADRDSPDSPRRRRPVIPASAPRRGGTVTCKAEEMGGLGKCCKRS